MDEQDQLYVNQMDAWFKEMDAVEKQIRCTIETSTEIVVQNEIQLEWHLKRKDKAIQEHKEWLADKAGSETADTLSED